MLKKFLLVVGLLAGLFSLQAEAAARKSRATPATPLTPEAYQQLNKRIDQLTKSMEPDDFREVGQEIDRLQLAAKAKEPAEYEKQRTQKTKLWLKAISVVHKRIDPGFDRNDPPSLNLSPSDPHYPAGVSPNAIADPKVRRQYEEALDKNGDKIKRHNLQLQLLRLRDYWPKDIFLFVGSQYKKADEQDQRDLKKLLEEHLKDQKLRADLESTFKELDKKYDVSHGSWGRRPPAKQDSDK